MSESTPDELRALLARAMDASGIDSGSVLAQADRMRAEYEATEARRREADRHRKSGHAAETALEWAEQVGAGDDSGELAERYAAGLAAVYDPTGTAPEPEPLERAPEPGETFARVRPDPTAVDEAIHALRSARSRKPRKGKRVEHGRHIDRYRKRLRDLGQHDANPREMPHWVWGVVGMILGDPTGGTARAALAELPEGIQVRVRRAARGRLHDGSPRYGWGTTRARCIVALALVVYKTREPTGRKGWAGVIRGFPRRLLASLMLNPGTGFTYSVNSLFGTKHRGDERKGRWQDGTCGYMVALQQCGMFYRQQPPAHVVAPSDRGPVYAINLYWIHRRVLEAHPEGAECLAELLAKYVRPKGRPRAKAPAGAIRAAPT